jgi:predicted Zn-dependent protease
MKAAREQVKMLDAKPKTLDPGHYRVYLAPAAVMELLSMLNWGAFGLKSQKTKQSSLLRLALGEASFDPRFTLKENTKEGTAPNFQPEGFLKPDSVTLIEEGKYANSLVSGRSAREYGVGANGAEPDESSVSMDVSPGDLPMADVLKKLDTGMYINNLWYLNYSDRPACRITGMTRFACFWVEKGKIKSPLNVMRFDESLYRAFGSNLMALTKEREMILDTSTYENRSCQSFHLPGALVEDFCFNL